MRISTLAKIIGIIIFALLLSFCLMPGYALEKSDSYDDLPLEESNLITSKKEDGEDNESFESEYLPEEGSPSVFQSLAPEPPTGCNREVFPYPDEAESESEPPATVRASFAAGISPSACRRICRNPAGRGS